MKKIKYVIITGCSTGIGYATAKYLKEKKYKVIVSCRKNKDVKILSKEFNYSIQLDTSSSNSIKKAYILIKKIVKKKHNLWNILQCWLWTVWGSRRFK